MPHPPIGLTTRNDIIQTQCGNCFVQMDGPNIWARSVFDVGSLVFFGQEFH
jgi:hypothetical protein